MTLLPANSYRKTRGIIRRGTRANQPVATSVLEGTLYFVTDEGVIERSNGSAWESFSGSGGSVSISNIPVLMPFVTEYEEAEIPYIIPGPRGIDGVAGSAGINGINGINGRVGLDGIDGENTEIIIQGSPISGGSTVPGGSSGQVQFNNGGVFGGDADLTFSGDTLTVTKINIGGDLVTTVNGAVIRNNTSDGSDNRYLAIAGGGTFTNDGTRGGWMTFHGNEEGSPGMVQFMPGNASGSVLRFRRGSDGLDSFSMDGSTGNLIFSYRVTLNSLINLKNYTVATLPAGTRGDIAYVTDALAPSFLAVLVGGGTVVTPCFYNGANWVGF